MFECERCGSSYSATHLGVEHCPRCQLRDQIQAPLAFKAFQRLEAETSGAGSPPGSAATTEPAAPAPVEAS